MTVMSEIKRDIKDIMTIILLTSFTVTAMAGCTFFIAVMMKSYMGT